MVLQKLFVARPRANDHSSVLASSPLMHQAAALALVYRGRQLSIANRPVDLLCAVFAQPAQEPAKETSVRAHGHSSMMSPSRRGMVTFHEFSLVRTRS